MRNNHSIIEAQILNPDALHEVARYIADLNRATHRELIHVASQRAFDIDGPNASFRFDKGHVSAISPESATHLLIAQMSRDTRRGLITAAQLLRLQVITKDVHDAVLSLDVDHYIKSGEIRKAQFYRVCVPDRGWTVTEPYMGKTLPEQKWNNVSYGGPKLEAGTDNSYSRSKNVLTINKDNPGSVIVQYMYKDVDGLKWSVNPNITHWIEYPTIEV